MSQHPSKYYLFYDGECGFCSRWVQWILSRDHKDRFLFAPLKGHTAQSFLAERGLSSINTDTIYLWKPQKYYLTKSEAVLKCLEILGGRFSLITKLNFLPANITDALYDIVAARRKKLFTTSCQLPNDRDRAKFLP